MSSLSVMLILRAPQERSFSIEAVFKTVAAHFPRDVDASITTIPFPSRGLTSRLKGIWFARKITRHADVVHITGDTHYLNLLLRRKRTVLTIHDCEFIERSRGLKRCILWLFWLRIPIWRSAAVTVVSEASKEQLLRWVKIPTDRVEVIENPLSKALPRTDKSLAETPRLLMIGTAPHKNIERVAKAVAGLDVSLEVIGRLTPERLTALNTHVPVTCRYDLTDEALAQAYIDSDILMFPSLSEGFGLPILEAQSVGRPVITSNRLPMSNVAGSGAIIVDPEDTAALRDAVERLISNPGLRSKLVTDGYANVLRFTPQEAAQNYASIYRRVAAAI